jgi:hypothetical protein
MTRGVARAVLMTAGVLLAVVGSAAGQWRPGIPPSPPTSPPRYLPPAPRVEADQTVYRYYQEFDAKHYYSDRTDVERMARRGYDYEGIAFYLSSQPGPGLAPLYHFRLPSGGHFYTTDRAEGVRLGAELGERLGYVSTVPRPGWRPLYAWYRPEVDQYFYTTHRDGEVAPLAGYRSIGVVGYVVPYRVD